MSPVAASGCPTAATGTDLSRYRIGDLLLSGTGSYYLLGDDKPERLSDFDAHGLRRRGLAGAGGARATSPRPSVTRRPLPSGRPDVPQPITNGALCAVLHPEAQSDASFSLATNPTGAADPAEVVRPGRHAVDVEPSAGAYVLSGSGDAADAGTRYVIDPKGEKYELVGSEVPDFLGYGDVDPPLVPSAWLEFFEPGVQLSTNSARRVPEDAPPADDAAADAG